MSDGSFIQILVFAAIAAFIGLRLYNVLGRRTGHEKPPPRPARPRQDGGDKVIALPDRTSEQALRSQAEGQGASGGLAAGLTQVKLADPAFDREHFLAGARAAFEMIVDAFAKGDLQPVRAFLSQPVFDSFAVAVREREASGLARETTLVAIHEATIVEAAVERRVARITVKFVSEQINLARDKSGAVVEGRPGASQTVTDIWTFERDARSRDPNWTLVATRSAH
jgi:predicted lipid-binding transport protein (Tim44 family)